MPIWREESSATARLDLISPLDSISPLDNDFGGQSGPKDNHERAPAQTGSVICCTLEAVDIECRSPQAEELPKRATKL
jgi:hypothetical protein